jgi:predicted nucleic acid-binding protein
MREVTQPLATCEAVITESCFLLDRVPGATEAILANVASRAFQIRFSLKDSIQSVQALMYKYRDMPMSLADACLIQMADELGTGNILTLDSDFEHYRWRKIKRFNLLIPLV